MKAIIMIRRNAKREYFLQVIGSIKSGLVNPAEYIIHRGQFADLKKAFETWLNASGNVIKAMVEMR
jgi:threonine dehydrogenase-like Zn-dependent dehydrogenase